MEYFFSIMFRHLCCDDPLKTKMNFKMNSMISLNRSAAAVSYF